MQRVNQQLLLQQTNVGLLNIRQLEQQYYGSFYQSFGSQAALIGGFTYGVMTQVARNGAATGSNAESVADGGVGATGFTAILNIYWLTAALCMAAASHCLFVTMLLQVLGPGLALFGPLGSMIPANEVRTTP